MSTHAIQRSNIRRRRWALHKAQDGQILPLPIPRVEFDARTERNLSLLNPYAQPVFRAAVRGWKEAAALHQLDVQIISSTRTWDEQHELWLQGRGLPGPVVTNADAGQSNHNYGIACDIGIFQGGRYLDDLADQGVVTHAYCEQQYLNLVNAGERAGLTAGARWTSFQDEPHYELRPAWAADMSEGAMIKELYRRHETGEAIFP
jgi:peptidoglycan L-alanyl-D-glutamate endopeptidase CwlK